MIKWSMVFFQIHFLWLCCLFIMEICLKSLCCLLRYSKTCNKGGHLKVSFLCQFGKRMNFFCTFETKKKDV